MSQALRIRWKSALTNLEVTYLDRLLDHADTFSEPSSEDPSGERFDQIGCNLDFEENFTQFEFDLDIDITHEQAKALLDPTPEMQTKNGEEEN